MLIDRWGTAPESGGASFYRDDQGYLIQFHGIAEFRLSFDGTELQCWPLTDSRAAWETVLRQQVIPLQRSLQGEPVFHGGAVCRGDRAMVFLGPSGQGKSTLTAACAAQGMAFLTDDCLVLRGDPELSVLPDQDYVRLWPDSFQALSGDAPETASRESYSKPRLPAHGQRLPHRSSPASLAVMIALDGEADEIVLERLFPGDAAMYWRANAFVLDVRAPQVMRKSLQRAARLAEAVPAYRLLYPRDYARLPEVVAAVSGCLDAVLAKNAA